EAHHGFFGRRLHAGLRAMPWAVGFPHGQAPLDEGGRAQTPGVPAPFDDAAAHLLEGSPVETLGECIVPASTILLDTNHARSMSGGGPSGRALAGAQRASHLAVMHCKVIQT